MPTPTVSDPRFAELDLAVERALDHIPADFGGGCSVGKARVMARLIVEHDVDTAVEVGVYRGRSYIPLALAMRTRGAGRAVGVDPWAPEPAMQYDDHGIAPEVLHGFVREADWDGIKAGVDAAIEREGVGDYAELVRETSIDAAKRFGPTSVGFVHIDGNHDRASVEQDVALWLPLVRPGGFLVLDDASWDSVRPILGELRQVHELLFLIEDKHDVYGGGPSDFAVLRVRSPEEQPPRENATATSRPTAGTVLRRVGAEVRRRARRP